MCSGAVISFSRLFGKSCHFDPTQSDPYYFISSTRPPILKSSVSNHQRTITGRITVLGHRYCIPQGGLPPILKLSVLNLYRTTIERTPVLGRGHFVPQGGHPSSNHRSQMLTESHPPLAPQLPPSTAVVDAAAGQRSLLSAPPPLFRRFEIHAACDVHRIYDYFDL
ncbi:hypothetical protein CYLTODRAFT_460184 [Cylindrobasidium torrendii FP15055 ss-10]|uniref:Uncharacterized protein n=1 Tax=Cylindrobasidium torrendii FP15055 ss-10 TaxID=1314674 RepID=A0A0D7AS44_9AGAR|nr:hypothetical protein CYLTODRAFT_460184 [Cylindrobasidium torrendii FP15055 ss-10]